MLQAVPLYSPQPVCKADIGVSEYISAARLVSYLDVIDPSVGALNGAGSPVEKRPVEHDEAPPIRAVKHQPLWGGLDPV
jgi:hypothetical protein